MDYVKLLIRKEITRPLNIHFCFINCLIDLKRFIA